MLKESINAFGYIYEFSKKEIESGKQKLFEDFKDPNFQIILSYLCDIFERINGLNLELQGKTSKFVSNSKKIQINFL
jgi:hypothetical protein